MNYLFLFLAYLIGSIPFGLVFGKAMGVDVRQSGSGNIGATNVTRLLGKKLGIATLIADTGKALVPMLLVQWFYRGADDPALREFWVALCGGAAFLGHLFPIFLKFKGGKGVATALGIFMLLEPGAMLISLAIFIGAVSSRGYVSLGSLSAAALLPLWIWLLNGPTLHITLAFFIALLIWYKHLENIKRLLQGKEKAWRKKET